MTIRPWGMICTPLSQRAGWCWADAEQMAAEQLLLALGHHIVFSLLVKAGLFIYYRALHSCDQGMTEMQTHEQ